MTEAEDEEPVRFEWKASFVEVGPAFFDGGVNGDVPLPSAPRNRRNRPRRRPPASRKHRARLAADQPGLPLASDEEAQVDADSDSDYHTPVELYRLLDKPTRMAFRRVLRHSDEDDNFLVSLEDMLVEFKNGKVDVCSFAEFRIFNTELCCIHRWTLCEVLLTMAFQRF